MADIQIEQNSGWFEAVHQLHCNLPGDLHLITLSGVVKVVDSSTGEYYKGNTSDAWRTDRLHLGVYLPAPFDNAWFQWLAATPFVTLNSIYNAGQSINAGWAVDNFRLDQSKDNKVFHRVAVLVDIAVRDSDGYIMRIAYDITLVGKATTPPPPVG